MIDHICMKTGLKQVTDYNDVRGTQMHVCYEKGDGEMLKVEMGMKVGDIGSLGVE